MMGPYASIADAKNVCREEVLENEFITLGSDRRGLYWIVDDGVSYTGIQFVEYRGLRLVREVDVNDPDNWDFVSDGVPFQY